MTNFNERLDEILDKFGWTCVANGGDGYGLQNEDISEAKQAITSLIKELAAEAKPKDYPVCENNPNPSDSSWCNKCWACSERDNSDLWNGIEIGIEKFEQNLLEALEEA